jgi:hypothetical protein
MGTNPEIDANMKNYCNYFGLSPSAYIRQKLLEGMANDAVKISQTIAVSQLLAAK